MRWREGARQFQLTFNDVETPLDELVGAEGQGCWRCGRSPTSSD
jgi:hypothetical protein